MAAEMNVSCDFIEKKLNCVLPDNTMNVLLKVQTRSGEHTFREDIYTRTLKYRRWNNQLRPFCSLKRRIANIFRKRNSFSNSSRSTSTQTIINDASMQCKAEEKDSEMDSERESVHSNCMIFESAFDWPIAIFEQCMFISHVILNAIMYNVLQYIYLKLSKCNLI